MIFVALILAIIEGTVYTEGSYSCPCKTGFVGDGDFLSECVEVIENECDFDLCDENAVCEIFAKRFKCTCSPGYAGDGFSCADINECIKDPCVDALTCTNFDGGFRCGCPGSMGTGIKESMFLEFPYIEQPIEYDGVPRALLPPQSSRLYPGCTERW